MAKGHYIKIKVCNGKLEGRDGDHLGKQDPYVILKFGEKEVQTEILVDKGENPVWNETFDFK